MSRDKQIEEMTKHCFFFEGGHCCTDIHISKMCEGESKTCGLYQTLENLYNAGYRKASEVAREIFEEIGKTIQKWGALAEQDNSDYGELTELILSDITDNIAELKKKYTEGRE